MEAPDHVRRVFVDWSRPALPAAARRLLDRGRQDGAARLDGAVVAVPGARAGRRLTELLLDGAEDEGLRLVPPRTVTLGALPELLYRPRLPLAEPALARRAWAEALRGMAPGRREAVFPRPPSGDDLPGWQALGGIVERLHRELGAEGRDFRDAARLCRRHGPPGEAPRWEALAGARGEYRRLLADLGRTDREAARLEALERGQLSAEREIWLVGVTEMPGVLHRMLLEGEAPVRALVHAPEARAEDFDALGCVRSGAWWDAEIPLDRRQIRVVEDPGAQADEAVRFLSDLEGERSAEEITVGVPHDPVVPYLEQRLEAFGVPTRYAAGTPLPRTGPFRLLEAATAYLEDRRFEALAALARHPDLSPGPLEALDRHFRKRLPARAPAGGRARHGGGRGDTDGGAAGHLVRELEEGVLTPLRGDPRRLSRWMEPVMEVLVAVYGRRPLDPERARDRQVVEACDRLRDAADSLRRLPGALDPRVSAAGALRLLLAETRDAAVPPRPHRAAVELLGWLELHLDDAPALLVTGFNEPHLPESVKGDPFLPDALRARLGLVDNRRRLARDAYRLSAIAASRRELRVVAGRRDAAGDPLRPSRLMFAAPPREAAERVREFYGGERAPRRPVVPAGEGGDRPDDREAAAGRKPPGGPFALPPDPVIRVPDPGLGLGPPPEELRVTDFRLLLRDPYRFALSRLLGLERVDDRARELDGGAFGSLAHRVLADFAETPEAASADPSEVSRRLESLLDEAARRRYGEGALPAVRIQIEQLRARLRTFARWQAGWVEAGWRVVAAEADAAEGHVALDVDGKPVRIRGRIDRIDHHPGRNEWAVFDYKTGDRGDSPRESHRDGSGPDAAWTDLQLPLYRRILPAVPDLDPAPPSPEEGPGSVRLGFLLLPRAPGEIGPAFADWSAAELANAEETARRAVRHLRGGRLEFRRERASDTTWRGDPLAPLLGLELLAAAGDPESPVEEVEEEE